MNLQKRFQFDVKNVTKVILIILLLVCIFDMPYGYFELVRFAGLVGFAILAYKSSEDKQKEMTIVFIVLALLFQPFFKVILGREIWIIIDVLASIFLIATIFIDYQRKN
jgi:hypothetical protein